MMHTPIHSQPEWEGIPDEVYDKTYIGATEALHAALHRLWENIRRAFLSPENKKEEK